MPPSAAAPPLGLRIARQIRFLYALNSLALPSPAAARRLRSLRISGIMLCLSGIFSVIVVRSLGAGDVADIVALRILAYACWLFGGFGLWSVLGRGALSRSPLAALRGVNLPKLLPQFVRMSTTLFWGIFLGGLIPVIFVVLTSESSAAFLVRSQQLLMATLYASFLSVTLAGVGALCLFISERFARTLAILLLIVPAVLDLASGPFPNPIGFFVNGMTEIIAQGLV